IRRGERRSRSGGCSLFQRLDQRDVLLLGLVGSQAFAGGPGVPLGTRDDVAEAGLLGRVVALGRLLEQAGDLEQRRVVRPLGEALGVGLGGFELGVQVGHGGSLWEKKRILSADIVYFHSFSPARASSTSSRSRASAG